MTETTTRRHIVTSSYAVAMLTSLLVLVLTALPVQATPQAPVSPAVLFEQGTPWTEYLDATKQQHDIWIRNAGRQVSPALVDRMRAAGTGLRVLVVAEDWCNDSVNSIPYLGTLAGKAGVEVRVINSQIGKAIMEAHRTPDGRAATPTVILIRGGKEVASWTERPATLQSWFAEMEGKIEASERQQRKYSWYDWSQGADALKEIIALAEKTLKGSNQP